MSLWKTHIKRQLTHTDAQQFSQIRAEISISAANIFTHVIVFTVLSVGENQAAAAAAGLWVIICPISRLNNDEPDIFCSLSLCVPTKQLNSCLECLNKLHVSVLGIELHLCEVNKIKWKTQCHLNQAHSKDFDLKMSAWRAPQGRAWVDWSLIGTGDVVSSLLRWYNASWFMSHQIRLFSTKTKATTLSWVYS